MFFSPTNSVYFIPQILSIDIFQSITERACVYFCSKDKMNSYLM